MGRGAGGAGAGGLRGHGVGRLRERLFVVSNWTVTVASTGCRAPCSCGGALPRPALARCSRASHPAADPCSLLAQVHNALGYAYFNLERVEPAVAEYRAAVRSTLPELLVPVQKHY